MLIKALCDYYDMLSAAYHNNPKFSDRAKTLYYRPHMIEGVIDVQKYREGLRC